MGCGSNSQDLKDTAQSVTEELRKTICQDDLKRHITSVSEMDSAKGGDYRGIQQVCGLE